MKQLLLILLLALCVSAQPRLFEPINVVDIRWVANLPTTCIASRKQDRLVLKYTAPNAGLYECSVNNSYTNIGAGGADILGLTFDVNGLSAEKSFFWNSNFANFQAATCSICLGDNHPAWGGTIYRDINQSGWAPHYSVDVEPVVTLYNNAPFTGVFSYPIVRAAAGTTSVVSGVAGQVQSYGNGLNGYTGTLTMKGVEGTAYVRSQNEVAAYGGFFDAYTGGNSAGTNTTPMYGIHAQAAGGHNGTSPTVTAGRFKVYNVGGGGVGNITNAIGTEIIIDGSGTTTNFTGTTKGVALQGYLPASGGSWATNYGFYVAADFDRGSTNYPFYSLSTGESLFSGPVRGVSNVYDATTWNGSTKFTTEDSVRDKIEALILTSGITGSGNANIATMWSGTTTLTTMPQQFVSSRFKWYRTTNADAFRMEFEGSNTGFGYYVAGDWDSGTNYIEVDESASTANVAARTVEIGDVQGVNNGVSIEVDDVNQRFTFWGSSSVSEIDADAIYRWKYLRTLTTGGTTGAQTINRPYGSVNFAAAATTLVVTNSVAATTSLIFLTPQTDDATCKSFSVTRASGSFTITANAACTGETVVAFQVTN